MNDTNLSAITDYIFVTTKRLEPSPIALVFGTQGLSAVDRSLELYQNGFATTLLLSGGVNWITGHVESHELRDALLARGVPASALLIEDRSNNTLENVVFSRNIINERFDLSKVQSIISVCKHYHARRALMTMRRHFPRHIRLISAHYASPEFDAGNWFQSTIGRRLVLSEWEKIPRYLAQGHLEELPD